MLFTITRCLLEQYARQKTPLLDSMSINMKQYVSKEYNRNGMFLTKKLFLFQTYHITIFYKKELLICWSTSMPSGAFIVRVRPTSP